VLPYATVPIGPLGLISVNVCVWLSRMPRRHAGIAGELLVRGRQVHAGEHAEPERSGVEQPRLEVDAEVADALAVDALARAVDDRDRQRHAELAQRHAERAHQRRGHHVVDRVRRRAVAEREHVTAPVERAEPERQLPAAERLGAVERQVAMRIHRGPEFIELHGAGGLRGGEPREQEHGQDDDERACDHGVPGVEVTASKKL
jgi:hypothetical protein